jgi:adenylate cyclase
VGAEIPFGAGIIGVAAREHTSIRSMYMTGECAYSRAVREHLQQSDTHSEFETEIPFPGLPEPHSQLAVPVVRRDKLLGILYVESEEDLRFSYEDEDILLTLAAQLALLVELDQQAIETSPAPSPMQHSTTKQSGPSVTIRFYSANQSVFIDEEYLIKGVAGAIIWKLLKDYTETQRCEFSNRELRLDPCIGLPDISDNLEARLVLLHKRLAERCDFLRLEKTGRGRFRLHVDRPLILQTQ